MLIISRPVMLILYLQIYLGTKSFSPAPWWTPEQSLRIVDPVFGVSPRDVRRNIVWEVTKTAYKSKLLLLHHPSREWFLRSFRRLKRHEVLITTSRTQIWVRLYKRVDILPLCLAVLPTARHLIY